MVQGLLQAEPADWGQDTKSVTAQQNDVTWVAPSARDAGVADEVDGIADTDVLCQRTVMIYSRSNTIRKGGGNSSSSSSTTQQQKQQQWWEAAVCGCKPAAAPAVPI